MVAAAPASTVSSPMSPLVELVERAAAAVGDDSDSDFDYESLPGATLPVSLMAGAFAGITEHIVTYPFDNIKTRMQFITSTSSAQIYSTIAQSVARVHSTEGLGALWRGVSSVVLGAGPSHALYFAAYEQMKSVFRRFDTTEHKHFAHASAGVFATIAHDGFATPFDVIKQRMQISNAHRGLVSTAMHTLRTEGIGAFYVSFPTTLTMSIPYQCIQFTTYEYMRKTLNPSGSYDPKSHILAGAFAGAAASAITNPLDVAKTLLQTRGLATDSALRQVSGLADAFRVIYRVNGLAGFARGMQARIIANAPATAICWTTYEFLKMIITTPSAPAAVAPIPLKDRTSA
eukprot:jgi/Hompol1/5986/HPOL_000151-RA